MFMISTDTQEATFKKILSAIIERFNNGHIRSQ